MAKIYFFRVGMDTTFQRKDKYRFPLGMVFIKEDNDFVYLPLLRPLKGYENFLRFNNLKIKGKKLWKCICNHKEAKKISVHYDPCFNFNGEYSYGDVLKSKKLNRINKAMNLKNLSKGDLLVFCETLVEFKKKKKEDIMELKDMYDLYKLQKDYKKALYVIGYFIVKDKPLVYYNEKGIEVKIKKMFKNNAHITQGNLDYYSKRGLILVKGTNKSRLLNKAIKIANIERKKVSKKKNPTTVFSIIPKFRKYTGKTKRGTYDYSTRFYIWGKESLYYRFLKDVLLKQGF